MARKILTNTQQPGDGNLHYYHLPKGMLHLRVFRSGSDLAPDYRVEVDPEIKLVADPAHRYFLKYHANPYTSDQMEFFFTPEGFLKSISTTVKDETGEVIQAVVDTVKEVASGVAGVKGRNVEVQIFEKFYDPFDLKAKEEIDGLLSSISHSVELKMVGAEPPKGNAPDGNDRFGFFCRPVAMYEVVVSKYAQAASRGQGQTQAIESVQSMLVSLPHPTVTHFIEIPMASWVNNEFYVEFNETGYPVNLRLNKPSSALAFVQIPLNVLRSILELPAMLFKVRLDMTNQKQSLVASETQLKETIRMQQEMEKRQTTLIQQSGTANAALSNQFSELEAKLRQLENENNLLRKRMAASKTGNQTSDSEI
jgi:hypothetical protein